MKSVSAERESCEFLSDFDALLSEHMLVSWRYAPSLGRLYFSDGFTDGSCETPQLSVDQASFVALLAVDSQAYFLQTFSAPFVPNDAHPVSLSIPSFTPYVLQMTVTHTATAEQIEYVGHILGRNYGSAQDYPAQYAYQLSQLLEESHVASVMTNSHGFAIHTNKAALNLFHMQPAQIRSAKSSPFNMIEFAHASGDARVIKAVEYAYQEGRPSRFELVAPLSVLHSHPDFATLTLSLSVSLMPIRNRAGSVSRVLLQVQDTSREMVARRALNHRERGYRVFIENSADAIWCYEISPPVSCELDIDQQKRLIAKRSRLVEANSVMLKNLGVSHCEDLSSIVINEKISRTYIRDIDLFVRNDYRLVDQEMLHQAPNGKEFVFHTSCTGVVENKCLTHVWGSTRNVTSRKRYEEKLAHQALHDALTGLPNREALYKHIDQVLQSAEPQQYSALLLIDLDRFKDINDTLGHHVGDHLLQLVGPRLAQELQGEAHLVSRLGGDEFAVFLPSVRSTQQSLVYAHRMLDCLALEFDLDVFSTQISASIGVALAPLHSEDSASLLRQAEVAMYHAKEKMIGVSVYSVEDDPHSQERLAIISELGRAIREDQLDLYFQPKIDLAESRCYGFEALIRWTHPTLGFISPDKFIPLAELTSFIHPLTHWVLDKSLKQCRLWQDMNLPLIVSVNISARNLMDDRLPKTIERLLQQYGVDATKLHIEITESMMMSDPNRALRILQQLSDLGVHLAIDDFGTGYSSLAYLKRLPVKTLKIDRSFVINMLEDKQNQVIVNSTVNLAHNLGLRVVAEGVETQEVMHSLNAIGCDAAQGYFIAKPMPADSTVAWLSRCPWLSEPA